MNDELRKKYRKKQGSIEYPDNKKWCIKCEKVLREDNFDLVTKSGKKKNTTGIRRSYCKKCWKEYLKKDGNKRRFDPLSRPKYLQRDVEYRRNNYDKKILYEKEYRKRKPEIRNNIQLKQKFGITLDEYNKILKCQKYVCAICEEPESVKNNNINGEVRKLAVDHDSITKKVRGLLCNRCNIGIGLLKHNINFLESSLEYIEKYDYK